MSGENGKLVIPAGTPLIGQTLVDGPAEGGRQAPTAVGIQFNGGFVIAALCQADKDQLTRIEKMLELVTHMVSDASSQRPTA